VIKMVRKGRAKQFRPMINETISNNGWYLNVDFMIFDSKMKWH
jgi:hypothetical protein